MARILNNIFGHEKNIQKLFLAIKNKRLPSAMLFVGPSGIGKNKVAQGLAQALICEMSPTGCGECPTCLQIEKEQNGSYLKIVPDGTQIKIEQTRNIQNFLSLQSLSKARVVIIDDAHLLNPQAANSLLKTLEEPPNGVYFFLITPTATGLLPTIRSRCQSMFFAPLNKDLIKKLSQAQDWIVNASQGRFDQVEALKDQELNKIRLISFEIMRSTFEDERADVFKETSELVKDKETALFVSQCFQQLIRDILLKKLNQANLIHSDQGTLLEKFSNLSLEKLETIAENTFSIEKDIMQNIDRTLLFENFWIKTHNLVLGEK